MALSQMGVINYGSVEKTGNFKTAYTAEFEKVGYVCKDVPAEGCVEIYKEDK